MARRRRTRVNARLAGLASPVFLLDSRRRLVFFNRGCEEATGWAAEEVLGRRCDYAGVADADKPEALTGGLCPPPEVFAGAEAHVPAFVPTRSGPPMERMIRFFPLHDANGEIDCVLGLLTDLEPAPAVTVRTSQRWHADLTALRATLRQRYGLDTLLARSPAMHRVLQQVLAAQESDAPVLLEGELGTGKEHIARTIHYGGPTRNRAFVPLDCRRLPAIDLKLTLRRMLRSETDHDSQRNPDQPTQQPGTVYLAHLEDIPRDVQAFLVEQFGDVETPRRLRLTGGTTRSVDELRDRDVLAEDFFFLMTTFRIALPPLRQRHQEFGPLTQSLLEELNRHPDRQIGGFADEVWTLFAEYNWPGNVDELIAVIREAAQLASGPLIERSDLPFRFRTGFDAQAVGPPITPRILPLEVHLQRVEREQIELALAQTRFNKKKAADLLGITRPKLYRRMEILGIADLEEQATQDTK